jgi:hypothetical protein
MELYETHICEQLNSIFLHLNYVIRCVPFQLAKEGLVGDPKNRWFDKYNSPVTYKNGMMVSNCDVSKT